MSGNIHQLLAAVEAMDEDPHPVADVNVNNNDAPANVIDANNPVQVGPQAMGFLAQQPALKNNINQVVNNPSIQA